MNDPNLSPPMKLFVPIALCLAAAATLSARTDSLTVSVRGHVDPGYRRVKLPNGSFKPERYVIANGGKFPGTTRDASFAKVSYPEVAGIVARHLAAQRYFLAQKAKEADLLIAIYWGETSPFGDGTYNQAVDTLGRALSSTALDQAMEGVVTQPLAERMAGNEGGGITDASNLEYAIANVEMENRNRDLANLNNAKILGYTDAINDRREMMPWADVGGVESDLMADVEEERYYVVVVAYDFRALQQENKKAIRWLTRISIGSQGNGFDERLAQMVASAASAFGQQQGLHRRFYGDPRVELGELEYLGVATPPETKEEKQK